MFDQPFDTLVNSHDGIKIENICRTTCYLVVVDLPGVPYAFQVQGVFKKRSIVAIRSRLKKLKISF